MAVIGILICEILELEFAELLGGDAAIDRISVLEDRRSARLIELLEAKPVQRLQRLPHVRAFHSEPGFAVETLVRVLEMGLHRSRAVLRDALHSAAQELRPRVDAVLLGYGLCGNALDDPRDLLGIDVPVFFTTSGGRTVDDCVCLCLGGRDRYCAEVRKVPGTFFLTPGWLRHWRRGFEPGPNVGSAPGVGRILKGYERALLVKNPALADAAQQLAGEEFCRETGLRLATCQGSTHLLAEAWAETKRAVCVAERSESP
jgi:hypothetical protein